MLKFQLLAGCSNIKLILWHVWSDLVQIFPLIVNYSQYIYSTKKTAGKHHTHTHTRLWSCTHSHSIDCTRKIRNHKDTHSWTEAHNPTCQACGEGLLQNNDSYSIQRHITTWTSKIFPSFCLKRCQQFQIAASTSPLNITSLWCFWQTDLNTNTPKSILNSVGAAVQALHSCKFIKIMTQI